MGTWCPCPADVQRLRPPMSAVGACTLLQMQQLLPLCWPIEPPAYLALPAYPPCMTKVAD